MEHIADKVTVTDVLVVGGGLAGCFAAIKAKEQVADVILVDKGYISRSGCKHHASVTVIMKQQGGLW